MSSVDVLIYNLQWMSFNVFLAVIPVFAAIVFLKYKSLLIKTVSLAVWFVFLPNTVYLLTDVVNIPRDMRLLGGVYLVINLAMYAILIPIGVVTFILSVAPFEKQIFAKAGFKKNKHLILFLLNLLIGFGLVLGRIQRVNSWEVATDLRSVISSSLQIFHSTELLLYVVGFAVLCQVVYLKFKKQVLQIAQ